MSTQEPSIYDQILNVPPSTETPQAQSAKSVYDGILDQQDQQGNEQLMQSIAGSVGKDANLEGEAQRLGFQTGVGPDVARRNMDDVRRRAAILDAQNRELTVTSPILARQLSDPSFAAIAHDQLDNLSTTEKIFNWFKSAPTALAQMPSDIVNQWQTGQLSYEKSMLGWKAMEGNSTADDWKRIGDINQQLKTLGPNKTWAGTLSNFAGQFEPMISKGVTVGSATALAAGAVGAVAGAATGPGDLAITPAAALGGGGTAFSTVMAEEGVKQAGGQAYLDMIDKGIDSHTALTASVGVGLINGALQMGALKLIGKPIEQATSDLISKAIGERISEQLVRPSVSKAVSNAVFGIAGRSAAGGADMAAQQVVSQVGEELAKYHDSGDLETALNNPDERAKLVSSVSDAFVNGMLITGVMGGAGSMLKLHADMARAADADRSSKFFTALSENAADSEVRKRNPNAYENYVAAQADGSGAETTYIDGQKMAEVLHQSGIDPMEVEKAVPGFSKQLIEAQATGGDVEIPTAQFATRLAGTDLGNAMTEHLRLDPDAMSSAEAKDFGAKVQEMQTEARLNAAEKMGNDAGLAQSAKNVEEDIFQQLQATKTMPSDVARTNAALMRDMVASKAAESGVTPEQFYEKYGPSIGRAATGQEGLSQAQRFVSAPNGDQRFGDLSEEIANATGRPAGEIRLRVGDEKEGLTHIADKHGVQITSKGFASPEDFIDHIAKNFTEIYARANDPNGLDLVVNSGRRGRMIVSLEYDAAGHYYDVKTAHPVRAELYKNKKPLWERTGPSPSSAEADPLAPGAKAATESVPRPETMVNPAALKQSAPESARGGFDPVTRAIMLGDKSDFTTFAHESAHWYLSVLSEMSREEDAGEHIKGDMNTLLKWFGTTSDQWKAWDDQLKQTGKINPEQAKFHEQFAYSFEKYLADGKAPTPELQGVFDRFSRWIKRTYQSVSDNIGAIYKKQYGVDLPDSNGEVRQVMDRMVASDEQIKQAEAQRHVEPLFKTKPESMDDSQWAAYQLMGRDASEESSARLSAASIRQMQWLSNAKGRMLKEMQAKHDALRAETREEIAEEVSKDPVRQAAEFLKNGKMTAPDGEEIEVLDHQLDKDAVKSMFPESALGERPDLSKLRGMTAEGGIHPDLAADMFGFDSGEHMIRNIADAKPLDKEIDARTDQRMIERHGEMNDPESMGREIDKALHNDARQRFVAVELRHLQNSATPVRVMTQAADTVAQRMIAEKPIGEINPRDYSVAETKAARAAEDAMKRGDSAGAARAKRNQLIQHSLAKIAAQAQEETQKTLKYLGKFESPKAAMAKAIGADFMDRINELLSGYQLAARTTRSSFSYGDHEDISSWVRSEYDRTGIMPAVSDELISSLGRMHWKDMNIGQLRDLNDAVRSLDYIGRRSKTVEMNGKTRDVQDLVNDVRVNMAAVKHTSPVDVRPDLLHGKGLDKISAQFLNAKSLVRGMDAALIKMEQLFQWIDAGKDAGLKEAPIDGPMQSIFRMASSAEAKERGMRADSAEAMRELGEKLRGAKIDLNDKLDVPELPRDGRGTTWYREELLAVALNMGNESNKQKLMEGYGWTEPQVNAAISRILSRSEMEFVQGVWDHIGSYADGIKELQRRQTGITPKMIEPSELTTNQGTFKGGYYPVVYDDFQDRSIELKNAKRADRLFENNYARPSTAKGHTIERTGYTGPIYLSLGVISRHLDQVTHDLSWREPISDMNKVLSDDGLHDEIDQTYGKEYSKQLRPWLQAMANDKVFNTAGDSAWERFYRGARTNATMVGIGFRLSTMEIHGLSALSNSIGEVGAKWFAKGAAQFAGFDRIQKTRDFIYERSPEMANRMNEIDRNVHEAIDGINRRENSLVTPNAAVKALDTGRKFAFYGVSMIDMASAMPTWMGAYMKGMAKVENGGLDLSEEDAIENANRAVRNAHGGGGVKDLAAIQRSNGIMSMATMFYSFWNHMYNRQRDLAKGAVALATGGGVRDLPRLIARSFFYFVVPQMIHAVLKGQTKQQEDDGTLGGFARNLSKEMGLGFVSGVPVLRDMASAYVNGRDYTITPLEQAGKSIVTAAEDATHLAEGEPTSKRAFTNAAQAAGYTFGIPTAQPAATTKFLWDVLDGNQDPQGLSDWWKGVTTGRIR